MGPEVDVPRLGPKVPARAENGEGSMNTRWAAGSEVGRDVLEPLRRSLTVNMIMTPRADLETCRRDEPASTVKARNKDNFSFLPVVDGTERKRFLGLYRAERWFGEDAPHEPIADYFEPLSEDHLIGADASIIDFVMQADNHPVRLVVSDDEVAGLVSLSDLQHLPVRAAIFTLITSLEIAMAKRIETEWSHDDATGWMALLSPEQQKDVWKAIRRAKGQDGFVSEIVCTQLSDKVTIILEKGLVSESASEGDFYAIRKLRNDIAHANYYAETRDTACQVCEVVRKIHEIQEDLLTGIEDQ